MTFKQIAAILGLVAAGGTGGVVIKSFKLAKAFPIAAGIPHEGREAAALFAIERHAARERPALSELRSIPRSATHEERHDRHSWFSEFAFDKLEEVPKKLAEEGLKQAVEQKPSWQVEKDKGAQQNLPGIRIGGSWNAVVHDDLGRPVLFKQLRP